MRKNLLSMAATKTRHVGDDPNVEPYDPDLWTDEYAFLNAPGQAQIQATPSTTTAPTSKLIRSGRHGCRRPPTLLVIWGKHDLSFDPGEPERYRKDVPNWGLQVHVLEAGHFSALDTKADRTFQRPARLFTKTQK